MNGQFVVNPLANSATLPVLMMLGGIFSVAGVALSLVSFRQKQLVLSGSGTISVNHTSCKVLWQRYRTWTIIAVVYGAAVLCGPFTTALMVAFLIWQGVREFAHLSDLPRLHRNLAIGGGWLTLVVVLVFGANEIVLIPAVAFFGVTFLALAPLKNETGLKERYEAAITALVAFLYTSWLPAHLVALVAGHRPELALVIGLGVALSDVGAFCGGKTLGGPKLSPKLSPNKTWGGVAGNLLGAGIAVALFTFALTDMQWWVRCLLVLVIAAGSVSGDLFESLLKRQCNVKDAGGLLPGFGGLLDRIDSFLFVAPLVFYLSILEGIIYGLK